MSENPTKRVCRWYFGGIASATAASCTHPLDLLKVHLQTQQKAEMRLLGMGIHVLKNHGFLALYNGLSASVLRQLSYATTIFALYETGKNYMTQGGKTMAFYEKVLLGASCGGIGGLVGAPADLVNVRMINDIKLPLEMRRNYKHAIDGIWKVIKLEGPQNLYNGATMASSRAMFVAVGCLACYDQFKQIILGLDFMKDNLLTHFTASFMAGGVATAITMPVDVMKTRSMNAKPGQYENLLACFKDIARNGPMGFYKGFVPAFVRLGPHTVLTFIFFEQLRQRFGYDIPI